MSVAYLICFDPMNFINNMTSEVIVLLSFEEGCCFLSFDIFSFKEIGLGNDARKMIITRYWVHFLVEIAPINVDAFDVALISWNDCVIIVRCFEIENEWFCYCSYKIRIGRVFIAINFIA